MVGEGPTRPARSVALSLAAVALVAGCGSSGRHRPASPHVEQPAAPAGPANSGLISWIGRDGSSMVASGSIYRPSVQLIPVLVASGDAGAGAR